MPKADPEVRDIPAKQAIEQAVKIRKESGGKADVYFKFTCEQCGERCTFEEPNTLYEFGECCECSHKTDLRDGLVGFAVIYTNVGQGTN